MLIKIHSYIDLSVLMIYILIKLNFISCFKPKKNYYYSDSELYCLL